MTYNNDDDDRERSGISIYVCDEHIEWMDREGYNRSGLINRLLDDFRESGEEIDRAVAEFRLTQLEKKADNLENQKESVEREMEEIKEKMGRDAKKREAVLEEAVGNIMPNQLEVGNRAVKNYAEKAGITQQEFIQEMEERL